MNALCEYGDKDDVMKVMNTAKPRVRIAVWLTLATTVLVLSGCITVGPDYVRPEIPMPATWHSTLEAGLADRDGSGLVEWWSTLNDPVLSGLIDRTVTRNLDLREAKARLKESRARLGISQSGLFPSVDATASGTKSRSSEETGGGQERESYAAGFDAAWELDFFGGTKRSVEAAEADLQAGREDLHDVLVTLTAEVALNYIDLRTVQARLTAVEANLQAQEESHRLTLARVEAGLDDELTALQSQYTLENTRSQLPGLRTSLEEAMNRLSVLLGEAPGFLHTALAEPAPVPVAPPDVAIGVPADLLRRRPDIRRAERNLAAQTARIGAATAELYPKLTLNGSIGLEALSPDGLLQTSSHAWTIGPRIIWPVFDAGAVRRNIDVQSALQEQALIAYESTLLTALEEVENALVAYAEEGQRRSSLEAAAQAAEGALDLAQAQYLAGSSDFHSVLDARRSALSFQDQLAQSNGTVTSNLIRLYKALGGGWNSPDTDTTINNSTQSEEIS